MPAESLKYQRQREEMVKRQIEARGISDTGVLAAMRKVPRHLFVSEALMDQAAAETDNAKRQDLYAQASTILHYDDAAVAPIYWYGRQTLTKPYITRTFGVGGQEDFTKWDVDMEAKMSQ